MVVKILQKLSETLGDEEKMLIAASTHTGMPLRQTRSQGLFRTLPVQLSMTLSNDLSS